jgi:hypothetical protein
VTAAVLTADVNRSGSTVATLPADRSGLQKSRRAATQQIAKSGLAGLGNQKINDRRRHWLLSDERVAHNAFFEILVSFAATTPHGCRLLHFRYRPHCYTSVTGRTA